MGVPSDANHRHSGCLPRFMWLKAGCSRIRGRQMKSLGLQTASPWNRHIQVFLSIRSNEEDEGCLRIRNLVWCLPVRSGEKPLRENWVDEMPAASIWKTRSGQHWRAFNA